MYAGKGKQSWDDDNFDDDDDYYEEDEEYEEDPDVAALAAAKKAAEAKKAAAAQVSKKAAAAKAKAESAAKNTAAPVVPEVSSKDQKKKIEEDNRKMNYQLSAELFGGVDIASISRPSIKLPEDSTFETFTPKTDAEFELLAQYVGGHIAISSNEFYYRNFLKALLKHSLSHSSPADIEDISIGLATIKDEREKAIAAERAAAPKTRLDDCPDFM